MESNPVVTIVIVEGKALLVDVDDNGFVNNVYMEFPEYFNSAKDHESKVEEAKKSYRFLTARERDQIRYIALSDSDEMDVIMSKNINDLAIHYAQTYANEVVITAPRNPRTAKFIDHNLEMIKGALKSQGVSEKDIRIDFKVDRGEEPTRFIKVVSHLRELPLQ